MNIIVLIGRLTETPEKRSAASGTAVTSFTLAVDRRFVPKGEDRKADFIPCVAWRQAAEFICKHFSKGNKIALRGALETRHYTDKSGNKRTAYEVIVEDAYFCESKSSSAQPHSVPDIDPDEYEEITGDDPF